MCTRGSMLHISHRKCCAAAMVLCCCAGVMSWWCGLVGALHQKPEEWRAEASFAALPTLLASINQQYWQHSVRGSRPGWAIPWHTRLWGPHCSQG
jgi:hypothetical protein